MTQPRQTGFMLQKPGDFSTNPSPAALAFAAQFLRYKSVLRDAREMAPGRVDGIIKHVMEMLTWMAVAEEGEGDYVARSLNGDDMPGGTVRDWLELSGVVSETFIAAARGDGTAVANNTWLGIYGFKYIAGSSRLLAGIRAPYRPPITAMRFTVGGTRVAEWDLFNMWRAVAHVGPNSSATEKLAGMIEFPTGIAESPILIGQNKTLLVEFFNQVPTNTQDLVYQLLGITIEKRGGGIAGLNP